MRPLLLAAVVLAACEAADRETVAVQSLLAEKERCAAEGAKFFAQAKQQRADVLTQPVFAYNASLDACLCAYSYSGPDVVTRSGFRTGVVVYDVAANRELAGYALFGDGRTSEPARHFRGEYRRLMGVEPDWPE